MGSEIILVREYLQSLREDKELDHIFPLLLHSMGHIIVQTAKESKGQLQHGKDIISMGTDDEGVRWRYYFVIKGHADKNITENVIFKRDGIKESLELADLVPFEDSSIEGFNALPVKIVLVHNGELQVNARTVFEALTKKVFPGDNFERWDIFKLTDLFAKHLFGEFLLTNQDNLLLFKKSLVLTGTPGYDADDFCRLVENLFQLSPAIGTREFEKLICTIHLICYILFHYCESSGDLTPAKKGIANCVLKMWGWILKNNLDTRKPAMEAFRKLLQIHHDVLDGYFKKTLPIACEEDGLFSEAGRFFENVGYPLRAFEYLGDLVYFLAQRQFYPRYNGAVPIVKKWHLENAQKVLLMKVIGQNDGCARPLLDNHYIPIALAVVFFLTCHEVTKDESTMVHNYIVQIFKNIALVQNTRGRLPEMYSRVEALVEYAATGEKPCDYQESSSILITVLFELLAIFGLDEESHQNLRQAFQDKIDLQLPVPPSLTEYQNIEIYFFEGNIYEMTAVKTSIVLPETMEEFHTKMNEMPVEQSIIPRTDKAGFSFLAILSCIHYKNDVFSESWRAPFREVYRDREGL
jgi:hypothetical protein